MKITKEVRKHYSILGKLGGRKLVDKYGIDYMRRLGRKGGKLGGRGNKKTPVDKTTLTAFVGGV